MELQGFKSLIVYQKAYKQAFDVFEISKSFPKEEKYSLTDQIRRSSRSIVVNIAESWAKRLYIKAFINKISDALGEEHETEVWLDMSHDFKYISDSSYNELISGYTEIRKMLISILNNPDKFCK